MHERMKKQWTTYLVSSILIVYFLLAGIGANVVTFCCAACAEQGIEHVAEKGCSNLHNSHTEKKEACCHHHEEDCTAPIHHGNECHFWRVTLSDSMLEKADLHLPHIPCVHLPWLALTELTHPDQLSLPIQVQTLPLITYISSEDYGRTILSRHCILII